MKALLLCLALIAGPAFATGAEPPAAPPADRWNGPDKAVHLGVSFVLGFAAGSQFPDNKPLAFGLALIPGVLKEVSDRGTTGFSGKDMVFNAIGAGLGVYASSWLIKRNGGTTTVAYVSTF